jgi:hypothetical protein
MSHEKGLRAKLWMSLADGKQFLVMFSIFLALKTVDTVVLPSKQSQESNTSGPSDRMDIERRKGSAHKPKNSEVKHDHDYSPATEKCVLHLLGMSKDEFKPFVLDDDYEPGTSPSTLHPF